MYMRLLTDFKLNGTYENESIRVSCSGTPTDPVYGAFSGHQVSTPRYWWYYGSTTGAEWIKIELKKKCKIDAIGILSMYSSGTSMATKNYTISVSDDDITYSVITENTYGTVENAEQLNSVNIDTDNGVKYIKITVIDSYYLNTKGIQEINFYKYTELSRNNDLTKINTGEYIPCKYVATTNTVGVFSDLGGDGEYLPFVPTTAPNGYFNWIMVGYDEKGRKKLVADRVIQNGISWDTLNAKDYVYGNEIFNEKVTKFITSVSGYEYEDFKITKGPGYDTNIRINGEYINSGKYYYEIHYNKFNAASSDGIIGLVKDTTDSNSCLDYIISNYISELSMNTTIIGIELDLDNLIMKYNVNGVYINYVNLQKSNYIPAISLITVRQDIEPLHVNFVFNKKDFIHQIPNGFIEYNKFKKENNFKATTRLLTGGIDTNDKFNEYDKIIREYDLGGIITDSAVIKSIWNYGTQYEMTQTVFGSDNTKRVVVNETSHSNIAPSITTANSTGYRPVLLVETFEENKFLYKDDEGYKTYTDSWQLVNTNEVTKEEFEEFGMIYEVTDIGILKELVGKPKICIFNANLEDVQPVRLHITPCNQVVLPTGDINLKDIWNIDFLSVDGYKVKMLVSVDGGVTYKSLRDKEVSTLDLENKEWFDVDISSEEIYANAISIEDFNNIGSSLWNDLARFKDSLRVAYVLSDDAYVNEISMQADINGRLFESSVETTYDIEYLDTTKAVISIYKDGSYIINNFVLKESEDV